MKARLAIAAVIAVLMALIPGVAFASAGQTVTLRANGGSGITATIQIDGTKVTGTATGLNPAKRYMSLYYGDLSTPQLGQATTCADPRTAASPRSWGMDREWVVNNDGTGTLTATAPRLTLDVYTMSIREISATALQDEYVLFNPVQYPVRACGVVNINATSPVGGILGTVPNPLPPIPQLPLPI